MEFNLYRYLDYREVIENLSYLKKISYKSLAQSASIHTSYFSRVMMKNADFSVEQLYAISIDFKLSMKERDYFLLLGDYQRAGSFELKKYFKDKILKIQDKELKVINQLKDVLKDLREVDKEIYYKEAMTAKIHMFLTIEKYADNPFLISKRMFINEHKLESELAKLESLKLIKKEKNKIKVIFPSIHLDDSSPLSPQNHINWRLESIGYLSKRQFTPSDYHMSANFSADEETKFKVREQLKKALVEVQKIAIQSKKEDEVYTLILDLF